MKVEKLNESKRPLYVIKDSKGNQLSAPNPDDNELWDRVADFEARGRRGLCVVAYTGKETSECVEESNKSTLKESHDDTVEFVMQIEDMIRTVTPKIIDKAFGKSYSFDLDGEGSEEDAMDDFREAVHDLAMAIYSMVVARREGYDESLQEDYDPDDSMYNMYLLDDVVASMMDNATDDEIDADIKLFDRIKRILDTDTAVMVVIDDYYNPDYINLDGGIIADVKAEKFGDVITLNNGDKMIKEQKNGNTFLYFKDADSAKNYIDSIDRLYMDEEIEDPSKVGSIIDKVGDAASNVYGKVVNTIKNNLMK